MAVKPIPRWLPHRHALPDRPGSRTSDRVLPCHRSGTRHLAGSCTRNSRSVIRYHAHGGNAGLGKSEPYDAGRNTAGVHLYVRNVNTAAERAASAGAEVVIRVYGDRSGRIRDPFGHMWILATHIKDVSSEDKQRRTENVYERIGPENHHDQLKTCNEEGTQSGSD